MSQCASRRHTLLPLDDCLYALQATIPRLTRSSLHRCLQRHLVSRLPDVDGERAARDKFKPCPIGYFHFDLAEVRPEQGRLYLFVAIDHTSKFAYIQLHEKATLRMAGDFLRALLAAVPSKVRTVQPGSPRAYSLGWQRHPLHLVRQHLLGGGRNPTRDRARRAVHGS